MISAMMKTTMLCADLMAEIAVVLKLSRLTARNANVAIQTMSQVKGVVLHNTKVTGTVTMTITMPTVNTTVVIAAEAT